MIGKQKGFTLIELLVVLVIFSFIIGAILTVFINNQHTKVFAEALTEAQQSVRLSSQILSTDVRNMGYKIDVENKQMFIVYAGPYDIVFNADIKPYPDTSATPGYPQAIDPSLSPNSVGAGPYYAPGMQYETGAETYRYTLDYNDDGSINSTDRDADAVSQSTRNPNDYMLVRRIYGALSDGTNGGKIQQIALVRGPDQYPNQTDTTIYPLFTYWIDTTKTGAAPPILWGDANGDGVLSGAEIQNLKPIRNLDTLNMIKRVTITVTGETKIPDRRGKYNRVVVKTDVTPGNIAKPIRIIMGHVYNDANGDSTQDGGESGIPNWRVWLNTGDIATTDAGGIYTFAIPAGNYTIFTQPKVGWKATTDLSKVVNADTGDVHLEKDAVFGFTKTDTGWVEGYVYADSTGLPCQYDPDSGDVPIANAKVYGNNFSGTTDATGFYHIQVNANDENLIWVDTLAGVCIETIPSTGATYTPIPGDNDRMQFSVAPNDTAKINFYRKEASGAPCTTQVYIPNGGEIWAIGDTKDVIYFADGIDDKIDTVTIYFSDDAGVDWKYIGYEPANFLADTDAFSWFIDTTYSPTTNALIKVVAHDSGGNVCYDESDNLFTITYSWGFPTIYPRKQWVNVKKDTINNIPGDTVHTDQDTLDTLKIDTLYFTRYLLPIAPTSDTSISIGVATADTSLENQSGGTRYFRYKHPPVYDTAWAQFITKKWVPYRESIPPDTWKFYLWAYISLTNKNKNQGNAGQSIKTGYIRINKLSKRDSLGTYKSDTVLFYYDQPAGKYYAIDYDTSPPATIACSIAKNGTLTNTMKEDSIFIYVPVKFRMKRWNRLFMDLWLEATTQGNQSTFEVFSSIYYNTISYNSRIDIPHY